MPDAARSDRYWCDEDSDTWAQKYFSKLGSQQQGAGYGYLARLQLLAHRHFYGALPTGYLGDMPSSAEVTRSGEQGENVDLRVNWLRAHLNAKHQVIVAPKLAWGCQASNTDARSMADASRASTILEAAWKQTPVEQQAISAVLGALLYGEEFLFTRWSGVAGRQLSYQPEQPARAASPAVPPSPENPQGAPAVEAQDAVAAKYEYEGDIDVHSVLPWNCFRDVTAPTWDASPWLSVKVPMQRHELIAQYPAYREEILATSAPPPNTLMNAQGVSVTVSDPDKVMCHFFFHRRTPALPTGLQAVLVNPDCVMEFQALERCYWSPPIHRFSAGDLKGTPWGYSDLWEAMASQDLASDIQGSLATNIVAFAKQMVSAEADQNLNVDQIGNGPMVVYRPKGSPPPEALQLTSSPPEAFKHLDNLKGDQRLALGLNDVALGEAPTGAPNAQAWALLATAAITANSGAQRSWVAGVRSVARSYLAIFKAKVSERRKTAVIGLHGAAVPRHEEWDKSDFEGIDDVTVEIANPLAQTAAGRIQIHDMYKAAGFIQTPEQLAMVIETGQLNPLTQVLRDELIHVEWENEEILQGRNPPVKITDSHQMHIREHRGPTFSADGRNSPEVNQAGDAHIQGHLQLLLTTDPRTLAILGQAAPPPPQQPPQGQPSGAPPPGAEAKPGAPLASPFAQQGGVKLPTAPVNPANGAMAGPPGVKT